METRITKHKQIVFPHTICAILAYRREDGLFFAILLLIQLGISIFIGMYMYRQIKLQEGASPASQPVGSSRQDMDKLNQMRRIHLTEPLNERVRPVCMEDIIGQQEGIQALRAVLCSKNPQHVLIYGPPGVGKTCAARLVLEEARKMEGTPFLENAPFIEMDATCVRFDERAIADPLIGSVHDPIYQGAGQFGPSGIPQPKEGAVSRAHGGILFLDEIGELHPIQMNKLLKVLEDRKVRFESAYYNPSDARTPRHIHEIFQNGLPADFRLVGATTRSPGDIPPALRSRCMEIFFRPLEAEELAHIASGAAQKAGYSLAEEDALMIGRYSDSGREAVNIVQMAVSAAQMDERTDIRTSDIEWVIDCGHYAARPVPEKRDTPAVGLVNGLAVHGAHQGTVMPIEAVAVRGTGKLQVTGIVNEEEIAAGQGQTLRRTSTARIAAENALTVLRKMGLPVDSYDLHINFPGGMPVDGPSAGAAMAAAGWSALTNTPLACDIALTGELSVCGRVLPVGGVPQKIQAAARAGLKRVLIPAANRHERYGDLSIKVISVCTLSEVIDMMTESISTSSAVESLPLSAPLPAAESAQPQPMQTQPVQPQ